MSIRTDANDTFIFIPQSSNGGNNVSLGTAGTVTLTGGITYDVSGTNTFGGTVTLHDDSRIQVLDDGLLLPAVKADNDDGAATVGSIRVTKAGAVTLTATLADGTANGGDIILSGIGGLGDIGSSNTYSGVITLATTIGGLGGDASSSLADWTIL